MGCWDCSAPQRPFTNDSSETPNSRKGAMNDDMVLEIPLRSQDCSEKARFFSAPGPTLTTRKSQTQPKETILMLREAEFNSELSNIELLRAEAELDPATWL